MITQKNGKEIKIIDLGTALRLEPGEKVQQSRESEQRNTDLFCQVQAMVGTAEFVAPEVVNYDDISINTGRGVFKYCISIYYSILTPIPSL